MFDLPAIATAADVTSVLGTVVEAMAQGELTPDEAGVCGRYRGQAPGRVVVRVVVVVKSQ